jgi:hypothetical protein
MPCTRVLFVALCRVVRAAHANTLVFFCQEAEGVRGCRSSCDSPAVEDSTTPTSATVQYATPTKEDELEEQTAADAVDEAEAQVKKKVRFARAASNARYSAEQRRRTMPGSHGVAARSWKMRSSGLSACTCDRMTTGAGPVLAAS